MNRSTGSFNLYCICIVLLSACANKGTNQPDLYAIDSLLNAQANYLSHNKASLQKVTRLDEGEEEISVTPADAASWLRELEIFQALEIINKPLNRDQYQLEYLADDKSNLKIKAITTEADLPVTYLKIYYRHETDKIRRIEAEYHESNSLFRSSRRLTLEFLEVGNTPVLTSYAVVGGQKMFLRDSMLYSIRGALTISN